MLNELKITHVSEWLHLESKSSKTQVKDPYIVQVSCFLLKSLHIGVMVQNNIFGACLIHRLVISNLVPNPNSVDSFDFCQANPC